MIVNSRYRERLGEGVGGEADGDVREGDERVRICCTACFLRGGNVCE